MIFTLIFNSETAKILSMAIG